VQDDRQRRLAQNEALYREVNERVNDQTQRMALTTDEPGHYMCECSNLDCTLRIEVALAEYEAVRAFPRRFIIATGHDIPEAETIVERRSGYWVVEKEDEAGELVEQLDPRRR
jgi:hypothetical protein